MTQRLVSRLTLTTALALTLAQCAGSRYAFDPAPSPPWVAQSLTRTKAVMRVTGSAPVTLNKQRDAEIALDDARMRLAESLQAEVKTQSSDWSWAKQSGGKTGEQQVVESRIDVRSDLNVEGLEIEAAYRDEATRAHYVQARVDMEGWRRHVQERVARALGKADGLLQNANSEQSRRAGHALKTLLELRDLLRTSEADVRLVTILGDDGKSAARFATLIDGTRRGFANLRGAAVSISVKGGDARKQWVESELAGFFQDIGLGLGPTAAPALRVEVSIGARFVRQETVGSRTEHVYSATGAAHVFEAAGEWNELYEALPEERYTESHVDPKQAEAKAAASAAEAIVSRLRSRLRTTLGAGLQSAPAAER